MVGLLGGSQGVVKHGGISKSTGGFGRKGVDGQRLGKKGFWNKGVL